MSENRRQPELPERSDPQDGSPDRSRDREPILPEVAQEDRDEAWGEDRDGRRDKSWYRRERPPHHE